MHMSIQEARSSIRIVPYILETAAAGLMQNNHNNSCNINQCKHDTSYSKSAKRDKQNLNHRIIKINDVEGNRRHTNTKIISTSKKLDVHVHVPI